MAPHSSTRPSQRRDNNKRGGRGPSDRDGDVKMGLDAKRSSKIEKTSAASTGSNSTTRRDATGRRARGDLTTKQIQSKIARAVAARSGTLGDASMKTPRPIKSSALVDLKITGWHKSAASNSSDRGSHALKLWLEDKLGRRLVRKPVRIRKWVVEGDEILAGVGESEAHSLERMNGFSWAKATLHIERVGGPVKGFSSDAEKTKAMLQDVLARRYNEESKLLDLSALGQDEELKAQAIFDKKSTASKFFPAMMRVLELAFDNAEERHGKFESVSLSNNDLTDLGAVTSLSATLPKLKNLDLSNNKFENLAALETFRRRFRNLQHLIVSNNPLEQNEPNLVQDLLKWYPNLMFLNAVQVRTEEDIRDKSNITNIPFPIRSPIFMDEGGIAETFIRNLFVGLDADRLALAHLYYDPQSTFSLAVNTSAPRDPSGSNGTEKGDWEPYLKYSLNLKKIQHMPARNARVFRGPEAIAGILTSIPKTRHPDLGTEGRKWMIEAHAQPCLPDPTGESPSGVDGFSISIHGEYDEVEESGMSKKKRSFDHFILIGPALPGSTAVVRVVDHQMTIRAYGGFQAFDPEQMEGRPQTPPVDTQLPQLPQGLTIEMAEQLCAELTKQTNMTPEYSKQCLESVQWDLQRSLEVFAGARAQLPPNAFLPNGQT